MLTGDHIVVAAEVCRQVGIPDEACRARLLPQEKLDWIKQSERAGRRVLMVGDGINDAAALAGASVGVAMGAGGTAMAAAGAVTSQGPSNANCTSRIMFAIMFVFPAFLVFMSQGHALLLLGQLLSPSLCLAFSLTLSFSIPLSLATAADIVMMSDNLLRLPATLELCRQARKIILQNCAFSIAIKLVAVVLALIGEFTHSLLVF